MTRATGKRKRRTIVEEEIPEGTPIPGEDEPVNEFDLSLEQVQDLEALNAVLEQYGIDEGVNFKIFKVVDGIQRYVFEQPHLDEAFIQRERGGGNYVARLFINGKFKRPISIAIDDLPDTQKANGNGNGNNHQAFLEKMLMALILKENQSSHGTPSITELTQALANMDSLRGKQESTVDLLIKGIEMGKSFEGGGGSLDWKTELMRLAKDNLPGLVGVIQQGIAMKNGQPVPASVPGNVPLNPNPPVMSEEQEMALMLKHAIGVLKSQFMMGLDGESAVALIMTNIANPQYQRIIQQFVMMSFEELVALDADIGKEPFQSRFRFVHDGLRSALSETDQVDTDSERGSGNVVDLGRDGKPSKVR